MVRIISEEVLSEDGKGYPCPNSKGLKIKAKEKEYKDNGDCSPLQGGDRCGKRGRRGSLQVLLSMRTVRYCLSVE